MLEEHQRDGCRIALARFEVKLNGIVNKQALSWSWRNATGSRREFDIHRNEHPTRSRCLNLCGVCTRDSSYRSCAQGLMKVRFSVVVVLSAVAAIQPMGASPVAQKASEGAVFVGILRRDALFLPIAIHDGRDWWNAWPFSHESDESVKGLPLPDSLDAIPDDWLPPGIRLPRDWGVQLLRGG